jgi:hypothetical protein
VDAVAGEVAQVALRGGRDAAGAQQAVAQQIRQPLGILDIGLAPRDDLGMLRVDDEDLTVALEQGEHRPPVRPRRFHHHRATALQPAANRTVRAGRWSWYG